MWIMLEVTWTVLHDDDKVSGCGEAVDVLDYVGVVQGFYDL